MLINKITYRLWLFHILNTISPIATEIPQLDIVLMQTNSGKDTVRKTLLTIVLSCGTWEIKKKQYEILPTNVLYHKKIKYVTGFHSMIFIGEGK